MNKRTLSIVLSAISVVLAVVGIMLLPDQVVIQIGFNGQPSNVVSKAIGIVIPFTISIAGVVMYNSVDHEKEKKSLVFVCIGYLIAVLTLVFNLI